MKLLSICVGIYHLSAGG